MIDNLNISWKMVGCAAAVFFIISAVVGRSRRQPTSSERVTVHASFTGRIGSHLVAHAIISTITGLLGFNVLLALFSIVLAIPLMIMGVEVHFPDWIKAFPRSVATKLKDVFSDKKAAIKDKLHDAKDAVVRKVTGKGDVPDDSEDSDVDFASDEFWGGAPDPLATKETWREDTMAFDALPPEQKIAIFESAKPLETGLPEHFPDIYAPVQWYTIRIGRSTQHYMTLSKIEMFTTMWTADQTHTHNMDAKIRAHVTRMSAPAVNCISEKCARISEASP